MLCVVHRRPHCLPDLQGSGICPQRKLSSSKLWAKAVCDLSPTEPALPLVGNVELSASPQLPSYMATGGSQRDGIICLTSYPLLQGERVF